MILFLLSLLAGGLTVLAPCTISLLPVIVGGSLTGGQSTRRAIIVTISLGLSVIIFTLLLKVSTSLITIPQTFWQLVSGGIIIGLGFTMLFPTVWEKFSFANVLNRRSNRLIATGYNKQSFVGDILVGTALGPVFSSCSPTYFLILATVLPRSLSEGLIYLLAYTVGLCGGLLIVTLASQRLLRAVGVASDPRGWIKRSIGVLFLLLGIAIIFGYDKKLELVVAAHIFDVTTIEQRLLPTSTIPASPSGIPDQPTELPTNSGVATDSVIKSGNEVTATTSSSSTLTTFGSAVPVDTVTTARLKSKAVLYHKAPEITNPSGFVNTAGKPITFSEFKGKKVILVDFWTYSCINCQRTLPYVNAWYDKYHDQGLEIISIHTPEFAFEKVQKNVEGAAAGFGIQYPIVLDNNYGTWNAFGNQFWPRKYLIDIDGYVVYDHAGEGAYDVTEQAIQKALQERADVLHAATVSGGIVTPANVITSDARSVGSPETYFGSLRNELLANGPVASSGPMMFILPPTFVSNKLYLGGSWNMKPEYAETTAPGAKIVYRYTAKDIYFVASSAGGATLKVMIDGKPAGTFAGTDVGADGTAKISTNRLYTLLHSSEYASHLIEIDVMQGTLDAYTFTFG